MSALTFNDINLSVDANEARIQDLRLAGTLGFSRVRKIRDLIRQQMAALKSFGQVVCTAVGQTSKGGRPGKEYWLNEKQALYLCTKSEAPSAIDVTIEMVEVFHAVKTGRHRTAPAISDDCVVISKAEWKRLQGLKTRWKWFVEDIEKQTVQLRKTVLREGFKLPADGPSGGPREIDIDTQLSLKLPAESPPRQPCPDRHSDLVNQLHAKGWTLSKFAESNGWANGTVSDALSHKSKSRFARTIRRTAKILLEET